MNLSLSALPIGCRRLLLWLPFAFWGDHELRAQDSFTRITSGPVVSGSNSTVLAWGDFNNDGFQDLFVSPRSGPSLLYSNNGNGTFSQVVVGPVVTDSGNCYGATWGDYDNDGALDLFVGVNNNGNDWLYHNDGHGGFTKITTGKIVNSGGNANNSCWSDYDNDGFVDLFVANSDQNDFLYHNNGDGTFTRVTNNAIALKPGNSQGGSWADYDNDGLPDLFVSRVNEANLLYHNEGEGIFTMVTNGIIVHDVSTGQGTSWGDYDNDGYLDLFVANPTLRNFLYHNNGDGTFRKITNGPVVTDIGNGHGCGWADFDNDGYLDLFVANRLGASFLYHNNGDGTFTRMTTGIVATEVADAWAAAWVDYDNDGFPDLFVTELNIFRNRLYRNNGNSNAWLTLQLDGRLSNRAAIGAKVRVQATVRGKSIWQLREISGGGGLGTQNDLRASFGLGDATNVDRVRIEWPSGIVQELQKVAPRQFLTITEPDARITPAALEIQAGDNATFTVNTSLAPPLEFQWKHNGVAVPLETNATIRIAGAQAGDAGSYSLWITQPATGWAFETRPAIMTGPVVIGAQPVDQVTRPGSNAVFNVSANGTKVLAFQWQFDGAAIPGATKQTLALTNVQPVSDGFYAVVVSNSFGTVTSATARLVVLVRPTFTLQPLGQRVVAGGTATFSVAASGNPLPLSFRWRKNGATVLTLQDDRATNSFFTVTNVQAADGTNPLVFTVVVTNLAGSSVLSSNAVLTILTDTDGDGLPDEWELANGFSPTNGSDAVLDADGDGSTNLQEYLAGTDPQNAASVLRLERIYSDDTRAWHLQFVAASNHTYSLQAAAAIHSNSIWRSVADVPATSTNRAVDIVRDRTADGSPFFRLVTPRTP